MKKMRLDDALVARHLSESRNQAQRTITSGLVKVNGLKELRPGQLVSEPMTIIVEAAPLRFVGRGGHKLDHALQLFQLDVRDLVVADVGASTGGFTDAVLRRGARKVYAIDVGYGQLDAKLRQDERVINLERHDARQIEKLEEQVALIVVDVSFVSLRSILPHVTKWLAAGGDLVVLFKPQFEASDNIVARCKGVIKDLAIHAGLLEDFRQWCKSNHLLEKGFVESPLVGDKGNHEYLFWLQPES